MIASCRGPTASIAVMAGLVPAIHVCIPVGKAQGLLMSARDELRDELQRSLTALITSIASTEIDRHNRDLLADLVENYEFGVALEWLHALIVERNIQLSSGQEWELQSLAQRMKIDLGSYPREY